MTVPCADNDYVAAHKYLTAMEDASGKDKTITDSIITEATQYVFEREVTYLLTEKGEQSNTRVLFLIKELPDGMDNDKCCDYVQDMAIMTHNEDLAQSILELYHEPSNKSSASKRFKEAQKSGKFSD